jgi:hypothetical protein
MDSRPLLNDPKKLRVLIDSKTFDELLEQNDTNSFTLLRYFDSDQLDFIRTPFPTSFEELNKVPQYTLEEKESNISSIKIVTANYTQEAYFGYRIEDIKRVAEKMCGKDPVSKRELNSVTAVFVQAIFNTLEKSNIYVTNNNLILKNRRWFESHFPGGPLNIMTLDETSFFLDLFFKKNGKYLASSRFSLNKGYWYWLSMRLKLAHYNVGDPLLNSLANRFCYALMASDEMGLQYYLGVNNDTLDNTLYHFNYLITLITGIFDNLALKTDKQLGINFANPTRISLNNKGKNDFLKEVKSKRPDLRDYINNSVNFINLIYSLREPVVHREGLPKTVFEYNNKDGNWKANFIKVDTIVKRNLEACGDTKRKYDPFTEWGLYELPTNCMLDPYIFSIAAIRKLTKFVEGYLELLGYPSFIDSQKQRDDDFTKTLKTFEKYHLGF